MLFFRGTLAMVASQVGDYFNFNIGVEVALPPPLPIGCSLNTNDLCYTSDNVLYIFCSRHVLVISDPGRFVVLTVLYDDSILYANIY